MINLSFPTVKLKQHIERSNIKVKDANLTIDGLTVYGVTNKEGITITGNEASDDLSNYIVIEENQFAYNPYRINVGSIGLVSKGVKGIVSPAYIVFKTKETLNSEFLFFYLKSSLGIRLINWYGNRGGVRNALRYQDLEEIDIPNLTVEQQIKVIRDIKCFNEKLKLLDEEINIQLTLVNSLRQLILQEAVQGKLVSQDTDDETASELLERVKEEKQKLIKEKKIGKQPILQPITSEEIPFRLPKNWEWVRLGQVVNKITDGTHNSPVNTQYGDYKYITAKNIKSTGVDLRDVTYVTEEIHKEIYSRCNPQKGDILFIKDGATTGIATINNLDEEFSLLSSVALIKSNKFMYIRYLVWVLRSPYFYKFIRNDMTGIAITRVTLSKIVNTIIPVPPLNEQHRIVKKVDKLMGFCDEIESSVIQAKLDSEILMQSVLQEAVSGANKDVQDKISNATLGDFIKLTREGRGITVTNMVKMLGNMKLSEYSGIEAGIVEPDVIIKEKIASILGLDSSERDILLKLPINTSIKKLSNHYSDNKAKIAARRSQ